MRLLYASRENMPWGRWGVFRRVPRDSAPLADLVALFGVLRVRRCECGQMFFSQFDRLARELARRLRHTLGSLLGDDGRSGEGKRDGSEDGNQRQVHQVLKHDIHGQQPSLHS